MLLYTYVSMHFTYVKINATHTCTCMCHTFKESLKNSHINCQHELPLEKVMGLGVNVAF